MISWIFHPILEHLIFVKIRHGGPAMNHQILKPGSQCLKSQSTITHHRRARLNLFDPTVNRKQWEGRANAAVSVSMGLTKFHSLPTDKHKHTGQGGEPIASMLSVTVSGGSNWQPRGCSVIKRREIVSFYFTLVIYSFNVI
jgi:hypothetical protein